MSFFHKDFFGLKQMVSVHTGILYAPTYLAIVLKNVINIIEMKQGMLRIIDYDVEEKTIKSN